VLVAAGETDIATRGRPLSTDAVGTLCDLSQTGPNLDMIANPPYSAYP
jgi:hypothetical protein